MNADGCQFLTRAEGVTHQAAIASLNANVLAMRVLLGSLLNCMEWERRGMFAALAFDEAEKLLTSVLYVSQPQDQKIADDALAALASIRSATVLKNQTADYLRPPSEGSGSDDPRPPQTTGGLQ